MVSVTTDYGTFEGETVKEAAAKARKAAREAEKKKERRHDNYCKAMDNCYRRAFWILRSFLDRERYRNSVTLHTGDQLWCVSRGDGGSVVSYEQSDTIVHYHHKGHDAVGILADQAGWVGGVVLKDRCNDGSIQVFAVGTHEDQVAFEELPLSWDDLQTFSPKKEKDVV